MEPVTIDGITYSTLTEEDIEEAVVSAGKAMAGREPVVSAFGISTDNPFSRMRPLLAQGLSTIAKDATTGKVVGCRFTADWVDAPELESFTALWKQHDDAWAKSQGEIKRGEWAHWCGVTVEEDYLGRGICNNLYKINCSLLKSKGYKGALCENVSAFSAKAAAAAGAGLVSSQDYATWEYPAGSGLFPLAIVKPPHKTFQLRLASFAETN